ncbi:Cation efflux system protein CusB precursor [Limihaloglobus sulfuriphilus]|uniref:Cation efflux system protein CusB n=1 Tax=Limihaloglobus sulfuriphilus TaxID=1851148 RepID=A0A1Q2MGK9_9BACT|nr:efflux RND transporter periplasmic adaptor subunit [Limihaloglobus sulfuriphilus]AQQ71784.1 Cation efflux system protein CusB precursor [Limihaloglobus sulfuriphilus]
MTILKHILITMVCGAVFIGLNGCKDKSTAGKTKTAPFVEVTRAEKTRIVEILETTGDVVATNTMTLEATVEGPIAYCPWREGDFVEKAGQKLIEIDRPLYRQEVAAAQAALAVTEARLADLMAGARPEEIAEAKESVRHFEDCTDFAKKDLDRIKSLVENGSLPGEMAEKARVDYIKCHTQLGAAKERLSMLEAGPTKTEIAVAQADVDEAAAKLALAQAKLDECFLTSPFPGIITEVYVRPGDLATPRAKLLKMMDTSSLVVRAGLPESSAAQIRKETEAVVRLDAFPGKTFNAKIARVYPRIEMESRTRIIELKIVEPVELIPHLFARVSVQGRVVDDALVVPDSAIIATPRGSRIVYVIEDGKAHMRQVKTGLEQQEYIQITEGLKGGEIVVVAGNLNLKDGAAVQVGDTSSTATTEKISGEEKQ